jgi:hypothetical protein
VTTTTAPTPIHHGSRRPLLAALAALVVTLVAVTVYAITRPATLWDRSTPEGTVQAYVTAVLDGDTVAAAALLSTDSPCTAIDLDRTPRAPQTRVDLVGTTVQATAGVTLAQVRVRVVSDAVQPFGDGGEDRTFRLTLTVAGWRIDGIPWPLYDCSGG